MDLMKLWMANVSWDDGMGDYSFLLVAINEQSALDKADERVSGCDSLTVEEVDEIDGYSVLLCKFE